MGRTKFTELRGAVESRPGARDRLAAKSAETLDGIRLYELRHRAAISRAELAGRLDVTQGRSPNSSTPTTYACPPCASTSTSSAPGWNS